MQKIIIFVLLGVTLNCVLGEIVAKNFVKAPVQVLSETMATRRYANLRLSSPAPGEIAVNRYTYGIITRSPYRSLNVWERKLDADNLNAISTSNFSFYTTQDPMIYKGYAIVIDDNYDFENSTTSLVVQQWNLKTGESLPAFNIIKVSSDSPAPFYMNSVIHNDTVYVCYSYNSVIYVESFKIGGSSLDKSDGATGFDVYNTLSVNAFNVQMVAGGALPDKRVFVTAIDSGDVYHEASLDITSDRTGSDMMNPDMVGLNCKPYVTDKYYGSFCSNATDNSYYVSINAIGRKLLFTLSGDVTLLGQYSCGDHLVTITQNLTTGGVSYEIWNLETLQSITGKVEFLSGQDDSMDTEIYQAPEGSIYVMLYNSTGSASGTYFQANVGILLENKLPAEYTDDEDMIVEYFLA